MHIHDMKRERTILGVGQQGRGGKLSVAVQPRNLSTRTVKTRETESSRPTSAMW